MNDLVESVRGQNIKYGLWVIIAFLVVVVVTLVWLAIELDIHRQLMPTLPSPTPATTMPDLELSNVSFAELNEDPLSYLNQSILVTGDYLPVDTANCLRYTGPVIRWSLTSENLQLDAVGYERIVRLLPIGTTMTVEGVWRLYQGPLGCGKGPPEGSAWYLDVKKIVLPNPLIGISGQVIRVEIESGDPGLPPILPTDSTAEAAPTATLIGTNATVDGTVQGSPTIPGQLIPTETPSLPGEITPTSTTGQTPTLSAPTATLTPDSTLPVETITTTAVATEDPFVTPSLTPETPPIPSTATESPGDGYPGPDTTQTPTPTPSPNPYP